MVSMGKNKMHRNFKSENLKRTNHFGHKVWNRFMGYGVGASVKHNESLGSIEDGGMS